MEDIFTCTDEELRASDDFYIKSFSIIVNRRRVKRMRAFVNNSSQLFPTAVSRPHGFVISYFETRGRDARGQEDAKQDAGAEESCLKARQFCGAENRALVRRHSHSNSRNFCGQRRHRIFGSKTIVRSQLSISTVAKGPGVASG
jgi:hypothetical protein